METGNKVEEELSKEGAVSEVAEVVVKSFMNFGNSVGVLLVDVFLGIVSDMADTAVGEEVGAAVGGFVLMDVVVVVVGLVVVVVDVVIVVDVVVVVVVLVVVVDVVVVVVVVVVAVVVAVGVVLMTKDFAVVSDVVDFDETSFELPGEFLTFFFPSLFFSFPELPLSLPFWNFSPVILLTKNTSPLSQSCSTNTEPPPATLSPLQ